MLDLSVLQSEISDILIQFRMKISDPSKPVFNDYQAIYDTRHNEPSIAMARLDLPAEDLVELVKVIKMGMEHMYVQQVNANVKEAYDHYITLKTLAHIDPVIDMNDLSSIMRQFRKKVPREL